MRRLLELRYREVKNTSIRAAIEHRKLEAVKTMLCRSNRKMTLIASECGFSSLNRLSHIFTQRFGIPMREFRRNRRVS